MKVRRCSSMALMTMLMCIVEACWAGQLPEAVSPPLSPLLLPQTFQLDPAETRSRFEVKFMGFITVRGRFERTTGTLLRDPALRNSSITAVIDATSLQANTANARATNRILRGPEFFQVEKFPTIEFRSSHFVYEGEQLQRIDGALTLLGVTRPVALAMTAAQCMPAEALRLARCEASAAVTVKRSDYGMLGWNESVADEVKIIVELVAVETGRELPVQKPEMDAAANKPVQ